MVPACYTQGCAGVDSARRHVTTTMSSYVGQNADRTAGLLWSQFRGFDGLMRGLGTNLSTTGEKPDSTPVPTEKRPGKN